MKKKACTLVLIGVAITVICATIPVVWVSSTAKPTVREFHVKARQYAYDPPRIVVNKGDEIHFRFSSLDVLHGFFLEGHDLDALIEPGKVEFKIRRPSEGPEFTVVKEVVVTAGRPGKYRYRCSHTCGTMHPFMLGEMIVRPNYPFLAASGGAAGVLIAGFVIMLAAGKPATSLPLQQEPNNGTA